MIETLKCNTCGDKSKYFNGTLDISIVMSVTVDGAGDRVALAKDIVIVSDQEEPIVTCEGCGASGKIKDITTVIMSCDNRCGTRIGNYERTYCAYHGCNFCNKCFRKIVKDTHCKNCPDRTTCTLHLTGGN